MEIKLVIFDMGETLLNFGPIRVNDVFTQGARVTYEFLATIAGGRESLPPFWRYHLTHWWSVRYQYFRSFFTLKEFSFLELMAGHAAAMGVNLNPAQQAELSRLWFQEVESFAQIEPNLKETLAELRALRVELAIISNTFLPRFIHERQLDQFGLIDLFGLRLFSSETIWRKPSPRIYQLALDHFRVRPQEAVMVGDRLKEDVRGPQRLGMRGVFKRGELNRSVRIPAGVTVIDRIAELPGVIRRWNGAAAPV